MGKTVLQVMAGVGLGAGVAFICGQLDLWEPIYWCLLVVALSAFFVVTERVEKKERAAREQSVHVLPEASAKRRE